MWRCPGCCRLLVLRLGCFENTFMKLNLLGCTSWLNVLILKHFHLTLLGQCSWCDSWRPAAREGQHTAPAPASCAGCTPPKQRETSEETMSTKQPDCLKFFCHTVSDAILTSYASADVAECRMNLTTTGRSSSCTAARVAMTAPRTWDRRWCEQRWERRNDHWKENTSGNLGACGRKLPLSAVRSWGSDWTAHPGWAQSAGCSPAVGSCREDKGRKSLKPSVNEAKRRSSQGTECTHLSSLAMSLCWESSSISGRLVMMSRWTSTGATDTSSMSFVANSCSKSQDTGEDLWRKISGTATNTHGIKMTTLGSTTLSSHLNWFMMMRGILRPPSAALWEPAKC